MQNGTTLVINILTKIFRVSLKCLAQILIMKHIYRIVYYFSIFPHISCDDQPHPQGNPRAALSAVAAVYLDHRMKLSVSESDVIMSKDETVAIFRIH